MGSEDVVLNVFMDISAEISHRPLNIRFGGVEKSSG